MIKNAAKAVERLAEQQQIRLDYDLPETPLILSTDPRLAQQVLINLLSQILQHAAHPRPAGTDEQQGDQVLMSFQISLENESGRTDL